MKLADVGTVMETDVLVVGGGIAALFAAIKAKGKAPSFDVLMVDKCCAGASGATVFAAGVYPNWAPGDEFDRYVEEIITRNSEYMIEQDYVEQAVRESYDSFNDLVEWGVDFQRDGKGEVQRIQTLCSEFGKCTPFRGGKQLSWKTRAEAVRRGVQILNRIFISDLLLADGRCVGAVGFDARTGEYLVFKSKATVLATGGQWFGRMIMGASGTTGDGAAMAFRAGAQFRNGEMLWANGALMRMGSPGHHVWFGSGCYMVNAKGERFMERYDPRLMEEARHYTLSRAIVQEWMEGRGPCYLDCRHLSSQTLDRIRASLPAMVLGSKDVGLDPEKDLIEMRAGALNLSHLGGVRIRNINGEIDIRGVWATGCTSDFCGGADATAVTALPGSAVIGARAGERAAEYAADAQAPAVDMATVTALKQGIYQPMESKAGLEPSRMHIKLQDIMLRNVNLVRHETRLKQAIEELAKLKIEFGIGIAKDFHELRKVHEMKNSLQIAEVCAKSALMRTESRGPHYRVDYPQRDDKNWLKWIVAKLEDGEPRIWTEDIPIQNWKYKPSVA